ncbi:MAG: hypothetical protein KKA73_13565 [Chloroflexi bacterium]|nr:hypothetical protein [Chloroflexota bacterium]MBU1748710.1 hypothetical protein [Chloroflexota bacterium]
MCVIVQDKDGGEARQVDGRVAAMIRWLTEHAGDIISSEQGEVAFHYSGKSVKPEHRRWSPPITVT